MLRQKGPRPILKTKHPNNRGNRPYRPTPEQRGTVEALAAYGIAQEDISQHLGITTKTLERHFAIELRLGCPKFVAKAGNVIFQAINDPTVPWPDKLRAAIYVTKARGGWRDADRVEHTGRDGGPIEHVDLSKLTDTDLAAIERIIRKAGLDQTSPEPLRDPGRAEPTRH